MNKQKFLAELQRLLVFMTEEDKDTVIRCYTNMFNAAGPEREEELLETIGSPTKAAIAVSRGYAPGQIKNLPELAVRDEVPSVRKNGKSARWGDLPDFQLPSLDMPETEPQPEENAAEEPAEKFPEPDFLSPELTEELPEEEDEEPLPERRLPLGIGLPLFVLVIIAVGLPLAAVTLGVIAALLAPGAAGVTAAVLAAVGGLWCVSYMADAVMMFGAAFLILSLGILFLWGGIWADIRIGALYAGGMKLVYDMLLGRKEQEDE